MDERERRLVAGAASFYALARPGQILRFTVVRTPDGGLPSLTDISCRRLDWEDDREVAGSVMVRSAVPSAAGANPKGGAIDLVLDVGGDAGTASSTTEQVGLLGVLRRGARTTMPVQFDALRQWRTDMLEARHRRGPVPRKPAADINRGVVARLAGRTPAVLFGLHWLELGGAERWALRTIELAREAGLLPIVVTDQPSTHPWIVRPELDGAVVVPLTRPMDPGLAASFLGGIFDAFDVRGVHVHHSTWLYGRLPWIQAVRPDIPVVDTLHILEWRTGGFVHVSLRMSDMIDIHHVISPQMRDHLTGKQGIAPQKVALATLAELTAGEILPRDDWNRGAGNRRFTVAFVGRFTQQKRPYLFAQLAKELVRSPSVPMRFVMHGDGELAAEVRRLRGRLGLGDLLELRGTDHPVSATMAEADVLVMPSDNEGLALTTFEATRAGVAVISTDVGSQASIVADGLLCPRHPYPFLRAARERVLNMAQSDEQRKVWFEEQLAKADRFAKLRGAEAWTRELYEGWLS